MKVATIISNEADGWDVIGMNFTVVATFQSGDLESAISWCKRNGYVIAW